MHVLSVREGSPSTDLISFRILQPITTFPNMKDSLGRASALLIDPYNLILYQEFFRIILRKSIHCLHYVIQRACLLAGARALHLPTLLFLLYQRGTLFQPWQ